MSDDKPGPRLMRHPATRRTVDKVFLHQVRGYVHDTLQQRLDRRGLGYQAGEVVTLRRPHAGLGVPGAFHMDR